ncbi:hypothetical protein CALVIDRAFT_543040 [Calocera viscosa TUFC12733]|uniref:Uncharacterized protein n=1 Tax=Calocera viscosa (strain TUFC12733) TaxID=1330018 RepID=A0A167G0H6_CALVF|nr:hypothetical protein CALVIDRAFT_543040 [Calocera viscosa TUFC12733]
MRVVYVGVSQIALLALVCAVGASPILALVRVRKPTPRHGTCVGPGVSHEHG